MVGVYYGQHSLPVPAHLCHHCQRGPLQALKTHRTFHFCGIPILPLRSDHQLVCWSCGYNEYFPSGRNRYYPGRRNIGGWTSGGWTRGRTGQYDRREGYTFRFWPMRPWRYRYRWH